LQVRDKLEEPVDDGAVLLGTLRQGDAIVDPMAFDPYQTRIFAQLGPDARRAYDALRGMMTSAEWRAASGLDNVAFRRALHELRQDPRTGEDPGLVRRGPGDHRGEWMRA